MSDSKDTQTLRDIFAPRDREQEKIYEKLEKWFQDELAKVTIGQTVAGFKTVLDFGADPTGKKDSSRAFLAAAGTGAVMVPTGRFMIDKNVNYKEGDERATRASMIGVGKNHFGKYADRYAVFAGPNLKGFMFSETYFVSGIPFVGIEDKTGGKLVRTEGALDGDGYCNRISDCSFNNFVKAIRFKGGAVDVGVCDNQFVGVGWPWYIGDGKASAVTTVSRFLNNTIQYCDNCGHFTDEVWNTQFIGNTFERVAGNGLIGKTFFHCTFINNWWENRNGGSDNKACVDTTMAQQTKGTFSQGNYCAYGWQNVFANDEEGGNGGIGGVKVDGGEVRVSDPTGCTVKYTDHGMIGSQADWARDNPLVIQPGITTKRNGKIQDLVFRSPGRGGSVVFDSVKDSLGDGRWMARLRFTRETNEKGEATVQDWLRLNRHSFKDEQIPGFEGRTQYRQGDKVVEGVMGIPIQFTWNAKEGLCTGLGLFTKVESGEGWVSFETDFRLDNPIPQFTPEDRGVVFDGVEWSKGRTYDTSCWYQKFTVYFCDRSGKPKSPKCFHGQIQTTQK